MAGIGLGLCGFGRSLDGFLLASFSGAQVCTCVDCAALADIYVDDREGEPRAGG